jgi:RNA polymerase sigma-70 factor (sigma-E family)
MDAHADFDEFVSARWVRLYRLAYLLTTDEPAAEDLLQTAMERTFARWPQVTRMDSPQAYVRRLMVNAVVSDHRRPPRRREWLRAVLPERPRAAPEDVHVVDHLLLWPLVCALPERQRAAVVLRYYEDLSERETAEVLSCAVGTVTSQMHDAVQALRRGLAATQREAVEG